MPWSSVYKSARTDGKASSTANNPTTQNTRGNRNTRHETTRLDGQQTAP
jgi:hypothetical protein